MSETLFQQIPPSHPEEVLRAAARGTSQAARAAFSRVHDNGPGGVPCVRCAGMPMPCVHVAHWSAGKVATWAAKPEHAALVTAAADRAANDTPMPATGPAAKPAGAPAADAGARVVEAMLDAIAPGLAARVTDEVTARAEERLRPMIDEAVGAASKRVTIVSREPFAPRDLPARPRHALFERVLRYCSAGVPTLLVGPAGCGKTRLAADVAEALSLPFFPVPCSAGLTEGALLGRMLPTGEGGGWAFQRGPASTAYEDGGVLLLDEIDAADPTTLLVLNGLSESTLGLANRPGNPRANRSARFVLLAAANTWGHGADRKYVGRAQLDAATLNRFDAGSIAVGYDPALEAGALASVCPEKTAGEVLRWGAKVREAIASHSLRRIVSTRNLVHVGTLLAGGASWSEVREGFFGSWSKDERSHLPAEVVS